jgi:serine/threonine-protein kinase
MGAVYEAIQEPIERRVAIKVLHGRYAQEPEITKRFFNEARAVNIVDHPGIVQISDYGQLPTGVAYLVMEFLKGETIGARIKGAGGKVPVSEVVRIARQIAAALAAAHEKNVIHRDLKPDNIMLVPDPDPEAPGRIRVKLLDFGIAKVAHEVSQSAAQTAADVVMGTPKYMSPEQCRGAGNVDDKSDVYALGIIMYEMLTGKPPFTGAAGEILAKQIYDDAPKLQEVAPWVPANVASIVHRLLVKNKTERPPMRQVASELDGAAVSYPTTAHQVISLAALQQASGIFAVPGVGAAPGSIPGIPQGGTPGSMPALSAGTPSTPAQAALAAMSETTDDTPTGAALTAARHGKPEKDSNSGLRPQSTLGFSVGQSSVSMQPVRPRRRLLGAAVGGLVAVSILVVLSVRLSRRDAPMRVVPGRAPSSTPKSTRRTVVWKLTSHPAGAQVFRQEGGTQSLIGVTPLRFEQPVSNSRLKLRVHLDNYQDSELEMDANVDEAHEVTLDPVPAPNKPKPKPPGPARPPLTAPSKPGVPGTAQPKPPTTTGPKTGPGSKPVQPLTIRPPATVKPVTKTPPKGRNPSSLIVD